MSNPHHILPRALLKALGPARDGEDVGAIIADLASTGQIQAIAEHIDDHRYIDHTPDRNETISEELWRRIGYQGKVKDVWDRGTVRLEGDAKSHLSYVEIIGIKFEEAQVRFVLDRFGLKLAARKAGGASIIEPDAVLAPLDRAVPALTDDTASKARKVPPLDDRLAVTIDDAALMLSLGRTTIYAKISDGSLIAKKVGRRTLITTESIRSILSPG